MARKKKSDETATPPDMSMSTQISSAPQPSPEQIGAMRTKATAAAFGEVLGALMRSERHRSMRLDDIDKHIIPAIALSQFAVANVPVPNRPGETAPVGLVMWAFVSPEVDERLSKAASFPVPIARNEWRTGDIPWIIDAAGPPELVQRLVAEVSMRAFGGKPPKMPAGAV